MFRPPTAPDATAGSNGNGHAHHPPPTPPNPDDPISRAVRAGFEVAEQAVRRGFEQVGDQTGFAWPGSTLGWTPGAWVDNVAGAATRWLDAWSTILQSAVTATGAAARSVVPMSPVSPRPHNGHAPVALPAPPAALRFAVEIGTRRPVAVQLDMPAGGHHASLTTHGLHAPPALGAPALTDVELLVDDTGRVTVRVAVPDAQPAGVYVGAILDSDRGDVVGTLAVRLAD